MVELIGPKKVRTAVFISGTGSNLKNLIKFSLKKVSPIEVNLIVSNNLISYLILVIQGSIWFKTY